MPALDEPAIIRKVRNGYKINRLDHQSDQQRDDTSCKCCSGKEPRERPKIERFLQSLLCIALVEPFYVLPVFGNISHNVGAFLLTALISIVRSQIH